MGKSVTYQTSYHNGLAISVKKLRNEGPTRTETFATEHEALNRARELLDDGDHQAVAVSDSSGNVLAGVRLQLKLGFSTN